MGPTVECREQCPWGAAPPYVDENNTENISGSTSWVVRASEHDGASAQHHINQNINQHQPEHQPEHQQVNYHHKLGRTGREINETISGSTVTTALVARASEHHGAGAVRRALSGGAASLLTAHAPQSTRPL